MGERQEEDGMRRKGDMLIYIYIHLKSFPVSFIDKRNHLKFRVPAPAVTLVQCQQDYHWQ